VIRTPLQLVKKGLDIMQRTIARTPFRHMTGPLAIVCAMACGNADPEPEPFTEPEAGNAPASAPTAAGTPANGSPTAGAPAPSNQTPAPGVVSAPSPAPSSTAPPVAAAPVPFTYLREDVSLTQSRVVAPGETLRIGPGTTLTAATGVTLRVEGTLIVEGTEEDPVRFLGAGTPRSWEGIVLAEGGSAKLQYVQISGATYGIYALPGSTFSVDRADIGDSFKCAVIQSDGSFSNTAFHASGDPTFSLSGAAPITDVNGTLTIVDASPTVTNSSFDLGAPLVDMVRVRGKSSPSFDHCSFTDAHCGVHTEDVANGGTRITNSTFRNMPFGLMAFNTAPELEGNVFTGNGSDIGVCLGATTDTAPVLSGNYYEGGMPRFDASCTQVGTTDAAPAAAPNPTAGPVGL
jgi:hypothetical protein